MDHMEWLAHRTVDLVCGSPPNRLHKTRMCWHAPGTCPRGRRCAFAHSAAELRPRPRHRERAVKRVKAPA